MRHQRSLVAILALGILFVSPFAWGCEGTGMRNCTMSDCHMTEERDVDDCDESGEMAEHESAGCDSAPESWVACFEAPADLEPAKIDSASIWDDSPTPLIVLAESVEIRPPYRPPDLRSETISSQQHELGRFTLLSTFLL
mgnify:FL=1